MTIGLSAFLIAIEIYVFSWLMITVLDKFGIVKTKKSENLGFLDKCKTNIAVEQKKRGMR